MSDEQNYVPENAENVGNKSDPQPSPPVAPAEQTAPSESAQANAEAEESPNLTTRAEANDVTEAAPESAGPEPDSSPGESIGGEGQHDSPQPADVEGDSDKSAADEGAVNEGVGSGFEVVTENEGHEPMTTFHAVNQQTGNHESRLSVEDHPDAADAKEESVEHHDEDGVVVPGHEMDSEIGRALAIQDARARAVAAPPTLGDGQPGMQHVTVQTVAPVQVDGRNRRSDEDALEGHFVDVVDGDHAGRHGAFERVLKYGKDGWPTQTLVRTRDEFNELLTVAYEHLRPSRSRGGR